MIISGVSGSGKSVALHVLEDLGFYCIDNIPVPLLKSFVDEIVPRKDPAFENVGIGLDARSRPSDLAEVPTLVQKLREDGLACEIIFLQTDTKVLLSRFSETRRKHPLSDSKTSLEEAIAKERELLSPIINSAELVIDTTRMSVYALREQIRERVAPRTPGSVSIMIESFGYKNGLPANADFVFDVRCLPNPYWEPQLRPLSGKDAPVRAFLDAAPMVQRMVDDIDGVSRGVDSALSGLPALVLDRRDRLHGRHASLRVRRRGRRQATGRQAQEHPHAPQRSAVTARNSRAATKQFVEAIRRRSRPPHCARRANRVYATRHRNRESSGVARPSEVSLRANQASPQRDLDPACAGSDRPPATAGTRSSSANR